MGSAQRQDALGAISVHSGSEWEGEDEHRSPAFSLIDTDRATMAERGLFDDGQPEPRAG